MYSDRLILQVITVICTFNANCQYCMYLSHCRFREFDGSMLLQFKKMMQTAPQYFYHCLEDQFGLKVLEVLNFSRALEALL